MRQPHLMLVLQENVLQHEQGGQDVHQRGYLLSLAGGGVEDHVGDDTQADALGNGVEQGHCNDGDVGRNCLTEIVVIKADLGDGANHQEANHDQRRCSSERGDGGEDGGKQGAEQEQHTGYQCGQTGTATGAYTGSGFHEGGDGGSTHDSTESRTNCIGHQCRLDAGQVTLFVQHVGLGSNADQCAQGVKQVHKQECEDHNDEVQYPDGGPVYLEALTEGLAQGGEVEGNKLGGDQGIETCVGSGDVDTGQLADNTQNPGDHDAQQDGATDVEDVQCGGDQNTNECQQRTNAVGGEVFGKVGDGDQGGGVYGQTCILQTDKGNKQTDAHRHAPFEGQGDGVEDGLPHVGEGEGDKDETLHKHRQQSDLPGVAHTQHYGVGKVGV